MRAGTRNSKPSGNYKFWEECDICGKTILKEALEKHIHEFHWEEEVYTGPNGGKSDQVEFDDSLNNELDYELEDFVTPLYDGMDGSKNLGFAARDYGSQFGSYPLHDDYGDESGPD